MSVFDDYAKAMIDAGIVKNADDKSEKALKKYKSESYPRVGSDDLKTIEMLYGKHPETRLVDYKNNISEVAHPKTVIIAPSYDKFNGRVENENENQNLTINILMQPPGNGVITHKKYASDLLMELIRVANHMDASGNEEMRKLADDCIADLHKQAFEMPESFEGALKSFDGVFKNVMPIGEGATAGAAIGGLVGGVVGAFGGPAIIPAIQAGAIAGSVLGGLVSAIGKTSSQSSTISASAKSAVKQIEDLKNKIPADNAIRKFLQDFQAQLSILAEASLKYNELISNAHNANPTSVKEVSEMLGKQLDTVEQLINIFDKNAAAQIYNEFVQHPKILSPLYYFIDDDLDDVKREVDLLKTLITNFKKTMGNVIAASNSAVNEAKIEQKQEVVETKVNDEAKSNFGLKELNELGIDIPADEVEKYKKLFQSLK